MKKRSYTGDNANYYKIRQKGKIKLIGEQEDMIKISNLKGVGGNKTKKSPL